MKQITEKDILPLLLIAVVFAMMFFLSGCSEEPVIKNNNEFKYGYFYHSGDPGTNDYSIELSNQDASQWDYSNSSLVIILIQDITVSEDWTGKYEITGNEGVVYEIDAVGVFIDSQWIQITQGYVEVNKKESSYFELYYSLGEYEGMYNGELIEL